MRWKRGHRPMVRRMAHRGRGTRFIPGPAGRTGRHNDNSDWLANGGPSRVCREPGRRRPPARLIVVDHAGPHVALDVLHPAFGLPLGLGPVGTAQPHLETHPHGEVQHPLVPDRHLILVPAQGHHEHPDATLLPVLVKVGQAAPVHLSLLSGGRLETHRGIGLPASPLW